MSRYYIVGGLPVESATSVVERVHSEKERYMAGRVSEYEPPLERGEYDECEECPSRISVAEWDDDGAFAGSYDCGEEHCAVGRSA